jgi:serine/threonine protein kinase
VGNILDLIDRGDTDAYSSGSNPCQVLISNSGDVIETDLKLTIYKATLKIQRETPSSTISLKELHILNGTVYISNNITVTGNSTLAKSTIRSNIAASFPLIYKRLPNPVINFVGDVYTASFFQTKVDLLPITSSLYKLLLFPIMIFDAVTVQIYSKFRLTSSILHGETQPKDLQVLFKNKALLNIMPNSSIEISTRTLMIADNDIDAVINNDGNILLGGYSVIENSDFFDESESEAENIQAKINSATSSLSVFGQFSQTKNGKINVTIGNMGNESYSLIEMSSNQTFSGEIHVDFIEGTTLTTPYYFSDYNKYPTNWTLLKFTNNDYCPPNSICNNKESVKIVGKEGIKFGTDFAYNSTNIEFPYVETLLITNIQCNKLSEYYNTKGEGSSSQLCYLCAQNSSCNFCPEKNACVDNNQYSQSDCQSKDSDHATTGINSCCNPTCNYGGTCDGDPYSIDENGEVDKFQCTCSSFFWDGGSSNCSKPTMVGYAVIIILFVLFAMLIMTSCFYCYCRGQKELFVEELRQNLLHHSIDGTFANYVPSLQRDLILNDVFVKYEEISKEKKKVGEGSFGVVYKASFRGANVAVKQMRSPLFMEITHNEEEEFRKEAYMMSRLRHPNLVLVMGISYVDIEPVKKHPDIEDDMKISSKKLDSAGNLKKNKSVCIITEYLEQGSLSDILYGPTRLPAEIWTYELILTCALQAARGMLYLHSHSPPICHRDLKSSNLVVDDHWVVKVTDFGMSRIVPDKILDIDKGLIPRKTKDVEVQDALDFFGISDNSSSPSAEDKRISMKELQHDNNSLQSNISNNSLMDGSFEDKGHNKNSNLEMTSNLGTTAWCAPELLTASSTTKYSVKVDVYSFGMVLWELWEKKRPFEELHSRFDIMDAIRANKRPTISKNCPVAYKELIQVCWDKDPDKRPTFKRILHDMKGMLASEKRKLKAPNVNKSNMPHGLLSQMSPSISSRFSFSSDNNKTTRSSLSSLNVNRQTPLLATSPGGSISSMLAWGNRKPNSNKSNSNNERERNESEDAIQMNTEIIKGTGVEVINIPNNNPNTPSTQIPIVRAPLLAFERSLSHLAESPAFSPSILTGNSPFVTSQHYPQSPAAISPVKDTRSDVQSNIQTNTGGISNNKLQPKVWRDRYVMKFNGWKSSQPDNNLPPSLLTGQPSPSSTGNSIIDNIPPISQIRPLVDRDNNDRDTLSTMNILHSVATIPIQPIESNTTTSTSSNLSVDDGDGMFDMDDRKN